MKHFGACMRPRPPRSAPVPPRRKNLIMLETAKLLIEHLDLSDTAVSQYDKFGIRKLFAAHNALGGAVTAFYDAQRDLLDPAARNGAIGQKLSAVSGQIAATADALASLQESEQELFAREAELSALEQELEAWKQKAARLHQTEDTAADEIRRYQEQLDQLGAVIAGYDDELAFWEAHLGEDSAIMESMKRYGVASMDNLLSRIEEMKSDIRKDLQALDDMIRQIVTREADLREAVLRKQNKRV